MNRGKSRVIHLGLARKICKRLDNNLDAVVIVEGEEGSGKSNWALGMSLIVSRLYGVDFSLDNVIYSMDKALNLVYNSPPGTCIVWDEACYDMSRRDAMTTSNKEIMKMAMATRSRRLVHFVLIPHKDDLESYIVNKRACYCVEVYMRGMRKGRCHIFYPKRMKRRHGEGYFRKWLPLFRSVHFGRLDSGFEADYNVHKERYSRAKMEDMVGVERDSRYGEYKELKGMGLLDKEIALKWGISPAGVCKWKKKWGLD